MLQLQQVHHIAIICSNYQLSKAFYTNILGFAIEQEIYRSERDSYKLDLSLNGKYIIELFSFPNSPVRLSRPEATGLRHIALLVENIENAVAALLAKQVVCEPIRTDTFTGKRFTFFTDPDGMPIELYMA